MLNEMSYKEYLKKLNIIRSYLSKFLYNCCSEWLKKDIYLCIDSIDNEINLYREKISQQIVKKEQLKKQQLQLKYNDYEKYWGCF